MFGDNGCKINRGEINGCKSRTSKIYTGIVYQYKADSPAAVAATGLSML